MCYILQIIPAINNGSLENVKLMLSDMDHCEYITSKYRYIYKIESIKNLTYSFFKSIFATSFDAIVNDSFLLQIQENKKGKRRK